MADKALHERLAHLIGWDAMTPEARFDAVRKADLLGLIDLAIGNYSFDDLVAEAEREREDLDDCLGYYITDPDDLACGYYNISDLDQLSGYDAMVHLAELFPDLEIDLEEDMDVWLRAYVRRARLGQITGRRDATTEPGKL
ncbi:hypothetical protein [[Pseudomonas] boreopolis]|uniref:hypothetical protein n=1 Tax=Xanthomonas boreopolis TaxID=86183 RepID=UPI003D9B67D0